MLPALTPLRSERYPVLLTHTINLITQELIMVDNKPVMYRNVGIRTTPLSRGRIVGVGILPTGDFAIRMVNPDRVGYGKEPEIRLVLPPDAAVTLYQLLGIALNPPLNSNVEMTDWDARPTSTNRNSSMNGRSASENEHSASSDFIELGRGPEARP